MTMVTQQRVCVGVHVHAEPARLLATLGSLRATAPQGVDLVVLPDGADEATRQVLATLRDVRQAPTEAALGPPACFNRLVRVSDAEVLVLLESGSVVGPGWLERLLGALDADPRHGLAGPSTNRSWNEQAVVPQAGESPAEVARAATEVAWRFGTSYRTLEPLYSLADFCYAVRRAVVDTIGGADEAYGLGPCWEMDYNIRAARAGFRGVWARGAYVYRSPFTERRRRAEAERFEASRRLYQDRFCGLRLAAAAGDPPRAYEAHCRGDACEYFAPAARIQLHRPLHPPATLHPPAAPDPPRAPNELAAERSQPLVGPVQPLISCIMPTAGRPEFAARAATYFLRQDYPNTELIVVTEPGSDLPSRLPADPRIRYAHAAAGARIGTLRNRACELARGEIVAHWDDDDWYGPRRLSAQAAPILAGQADIVGLEAGVFFDLERWRFWRCTSVLHQRLFVGDVHGGTLTYRRHVWQTMARFPDTSLAEDAMFLRQALDRGARLRKLANDDLFVYVRHGRNAWSFSAGQYLDATGWLAVDEPDCLGLDRAFYVERAAQLASSRPRPLVTCIMPTCDRRPFVGQSIGYFLRQDYPRRELLILDDGTDAIQDLVPPDQRIRYVRLPKRMILGAKRNLACELASGEIIAHWDDDDWMAPHRLSVQVDELEASGAQLCGLNRQLYYEPASDQGWVYEYPLHQRRWVAGNSLCYRKAGWNSDRFPEVQVGEDTRFVWRRRAHEVVINTDISLTVALVHASNTSPKPLNQPFWQPYPVADIHGLLRDDLAFYASAHLP